MEPAELIGRLLEKGETVATAESCTGGLLAKLLTDVPGSSGAFLGGVVCYTCPVKERLLGVNHETLETLGAVSAAVAKQMAEGARRVMGADYGLATTGLAGPGGDGSGRPVGLVYTALAGPDGTLCDELRLKGGRAAIREAASAHALEMLAHSL